MATKIFAIFHQKIWSQESTYFNLGMASVGLFSGVQSMSSLFLSFSPYLRSILSLSLSLSYTHKHSHTFFPIINNWDCLRLEWDEERQLKICTTKLWQTENDDMSKTNKQTEHWKMTIMKEKRRKKLIDNMWKRVEKTQKPKIYTLETNIRGDISFNYLLLFSKSLSIL